MAAVFFHSASWSIDLSEDYHSQEFLMYQVSEVEFFNVPAPSPSNLVIAVTFRYQAIAILPRTRFIGAVAVNCFQVVENISHIRCVKIQPTIRHVSWDTIMQSVSFVLAFGVAIIMQSSSSVRVPNEIAPLPLVVHLAHHLRQWALGLQVTTVDASVGTGKVRGASTHSWSSHQR
jgi:hypothetical protein